jgi:hypothetical protein
MKVVLLTAGVLTAAAVLTARGVSYGDQNSYLQGRRWGLQNQYRTSDQTWSGIDSMCRSAANEAAGLNEQDKTTGSMAA